GHNVLAGQIDKVLAAHAADTDASDVQQIARRGETSSQHVAGHKSSGSAACGDLTQKFPARQLLFTACSVLCRCSYLFLLLFLRFFAHELLPHTSRRLHYASTCPAWRQSCFAYNIIQHGVRLRGMPACGNPHDEADNEGWKLVLFIRYLRPLS